MHIYIYIYIYNVDANLYRNLLVHAFLSPPWFRGLTRKTGFAERRGVGGFVARKPKKGALYKDKLNKR